MLFELPESSGTFSERVQKMVDDIVKKGAEGLMLHRADSLYHSGRSDDLLKLKPWQDAEATVIEILPGKGKFSGMMGALVVKDKRGHIFRIGSGFSDNERRNPPSLVQSLPINSQVPQKKGCHVLPVF